MKTTVTNFPDGARLTHHESEQMATGDWLPISKAPRDGTIVLLADKLNNIYVGYWSDKTAWSVIPLSDSKNYSRLTLFAYIKPPKGEAK